MVNLRQQSHVEHTDHENRHRCCRDGDRAAQRGRKSTKTFGPHASRRHQRAERVRDDRVVTRVLNNRKTHGPPGLELVLDRQSQLQRDGERAAPGERDSERSSLGVHALRRFRWISRTDTAAGVIPGKREAWPRVSGLAAASFWRTSLERPATLA